MKNFFYALILLVLSPWTFTATAADLTLRQQHPKQYVVQSGDTLWDIAGKFLESPWQWSEIWEGNSQVGDPNKIYPGDVLTLSTVNGQPRITLKRNGTVTLAPSAPSYRSYGSGYADNLIHGVPFHLIRPFLNESLVFSDGMFDSAPLVVALEDEHLVVGNGDRIYADNVDDAEGYFYGIYRPDQHYIDPETGESLGYSAIYLGDAEVTRPGDPATLVITKVAKETHIGDRLHPKDYEPANTSFFPRTPQVPVYGSIVSVFGGISEIGHYQVITINRGARDELYPGDVISILQERTESSGPFYWRTRVDLPEEHIGEAVIFRTFEKLSFALVMRTTHQVNINDAIGDP